MLDINKWWEPITTWLEFPDKAIIVYNLFYTVLSQRRFADLGCQNPNFPSSNKDTTGKRSDVISIYLRSDGEISIRIQWVFFWKFVSLGSVRTLRPGSHEFRFKRSSTAWKGKCMSELTRVLPYYLWLVWSFEAPPFSYIEGAARYKRLLLLVIYSIVISKTLAKLFDEFLFSSDRVHVRI